MTKTDSSFQSDIKTIKNAPLRVQNWLFRFSRLFRKAAYGVRTEKSCCINASLTLEAALVLPLFLFAMSLLILPLKMMDTSRKMQSVAEAVCKDAATYAYTADRLKNGGKSVRESSDGEENTLAGEIAGMLTGNALGLYAANLAKKKAEDEHIQNLLAVRSNCMGDGETITISLDYTYALPFSVFGLPGVPQSVTASRRAWIGREKEDEDQEEETEEEDDEIVYVGKGSTRYHLSRTCHYLFNDLKTLPFSSVSSERNAGGGKYHACPRCAKGVTGGNIYILPSGTAYHADPNCSAITAYVKAVRKSTVEYLGPCHYCGGGE